MSSSNSNANTLDASAESRSLAGTQSIVRASEIISLVASYSVEGLRAVDIAEHLGLARPTAHRILQCLVTEGWLMRRPNGHRYFLGHGLFELGLTAAPQFKFREICQPSLDRIARKTGHVAFLTIRSGRDAISIARSKGRPLEFSYLQVGTHRPLGIGAGSLAILMSLEDREVEKIVTANARRFKSYAPINIQMLLEWVQISRQQGFASHDERLLKGVSGAAVQVTDSSGTILGAISVSALVPKLDPAALSDIVSILGREARLIQGLLTKDIGYAAEKVRLLSQN